MEGQHKTYRAWDAPQNGHDPVAPRDALPEDDLVSFWIDLIPQLDRDPFHAYYAGELRGQPPFDVTMRGTLLVCAYAVGAGSSRKIAAACERDRAFRAIVGSDRPDFRTISDFRTIHRAALKPVFVQVLRLAGELGMVQLGNLSSDGTKMRAAAARHKAMSYGYMAKERARPEAEVERLLRDAERLDTEQDAALGSRRGDERPGELKRREDRLAKIREAKARPEAEARAEAEAEGRRRDEARARREAEGRPRRGKEPAPIDPTREDKAQTNFTDPEARIMKRSTKGCDYSDNAQAVVDGEHQIIVAAEVTPAAHDKQQALPMGRAALEDLEAAGIQRPKAADGTAVPIPNTADTGSFSAAAIRGLEEMGPDPYIAVERQKRHEAASGPEPTAAAADVKEAMRRQLATAGGKVLYAARKRIVEPVFGQTKGARGIRGFLSRGLEKVAAEWRLICLTHNLLTIWRRARGVGANAGG
jgi:transposase